MKIEDLRLHQCHKLIQSYKKKLLQNSITVGKWVTDYIQEVSSLLSEITTYKKKHQIILESSQGFFVSLICI